MKFLVVLFSIFVFACAEDNSTISVQDSEISLKITEVQKQIDAIDGLLKGNAWITRYANYNTYQKLLSELEEGEAAIKKMDKNSRKTSDTAKRIETLKEQVNLLKEYEKTPFSAMLAAPEVENPPRIINPIALISGFSYIKKVKTNKDEYSRHILELDMVLSRLDEKEKLLVAMLDLDNSEENRNLLYSTRQEISELSAAKQIAQTTFSVYGKRADEAISIATNDIKAQFFSMLNITIWLIATIILSFLAKFIAKRTITDNERFYTVNKFLNFLNVTLIILILLFAYIENVTYIVTVLGFASAGIAIAMKDMFMSMLGWMVIMFGGSIHVGDRIRVLHNGSEFTGDIIDISLLRMTVFEDVTYTTYKVNRRAGRIVFIPNNYIFTDLIANYSHYGMKTVWDGIDIVLSFDSNHKKAVYIAKSIVRKYSKGYTDIAKRQMTKLRSQYSIKNPNVEPKVFTFFEPYGVNISSWYMTNSYAALALRSTISAEIIDAFNKEDDIKIAYPTQTMYLSKKQDPSPHSELENESSWI
ncbi:mechanosensitive ion channel [Campylobacter sp. RM9344]|uniref:Mechanosensitive ion channel n=1 Tax=Campylobacter californiensis TaxID=1032243 RepID=A0AAW3ZVJ7_9BACT|nr:MULTISPECIES: mechanosensitive ion channel domain-containing protein [unclassified Campylobacter]MBE2984333.1 mechanosensitive ion channel [Campylobacter sp. RM6883]MBE2985913.1 mechanosensitive ion channel [Campylobacter sp. RM12919]MBE2988114.1 mechanosensitive ion channel [Campylobacter sp. RM12920]MBE2994800.1 mechanosensitive ion channel [Campylobacter sp. RM6913]MBE3029424.1 mechanosensitive ion channel [Campylobacter sp. RM9344]